MTKRIIAQPKPDFKPPAPTLAQLEALQRDYLASHPAVCWNSTPYAAQIAALEGER